MTTLTPAQKKSITDYIRNLSSNVNDDWKEYSEKTDTNEADKNGHSEEELFYQRYCS